MGVNLTLELGTWNKFAGTPKRMLGRPRFPLLIKFQQKKESNK